MASAANKKIGFHQRSQRKIGVLLVNLGSPQQLKLYSVANFLRQFLSDYRVIQLSRIIWLPLLYGVIIPLRTRRVLRDYKEVSIHGQSPLRVYSQRLSHLVQKQLNAKMPSKFAVTLAMRYGQPSIDQCLDQFKEQAIDRIIVLPLFPQYSRTTTASVFDAYAKALKQRVYLPETHFINHYADDPGYIAALANQVQQHWKQKGSRAPLWITYHGLPKDSLKSGDPYYCYCAKTTRLLAEHLGLKAHEFKMVFQSEFGYQEWFEPNLLKSLMAFEKSDALPERIDVIAPGFPVDCLETLFEIAEDYRDKFKQQTGKCLCYIPALNDSPDAAVWMADFLIKKAAL